MFFVMTLSSQNHDTFITQPITYYPPGLRHRDLEQMEPKVNSLTPFEGGKLVILLHNST